MKTSPIKYHFQSSFEFCMGRGFRAGSFVSELNKSFNDRTSLTLYIPSYFGPTLHTKGRSSGPPTISSTRDCTNLKFLQGIRYTLQGLRKHKVCKKSFVWLPWQLFDNMVLFANNCQDKYEKQVFFKCSQKPQIRRC